MNIVLCGNYNSRSDLALSRNDLYSQVDYGSMGGGGSGSSIDYCSIDEQVDRRSRYTQGNI